MSETYKTQSAAALAVSNGAGCHVSRLGVVTSLDGGTVFGRVEKLAPGRWIIAARYDEETNR